MLDEMPQKVEDLRLDRARLSAGDQFAGLRNKFAIAETVAHGLSYRRALPMKTPFRSGQGKTGKRQGKGKPAFKRPDPARPILAPSYRGAEHDIDRPGTDPPPA
jgi:hypothetical protein